MFSLVSLVDADASDLESQLCLKDAELRLEEAALSMPDRSPRCQAAPSWPWSPASGCSPEPSELGDGDLVLAQESEWSPRFAVTIASMTVASALAVTTACRTTAELLT